MLALLVNIKIQYEVCTNKPLHFRNLLCLTTELNNFVKH